MWVRMSKCNLTKGYGIIDGILVGVYSDDEEEPIQIEIWDEESDDILDRTTCGMNIGVIECLNAEIEVRDYA